MATHIEVTKTTTLVDKNGREITLQAGAGYDPDVWTPTGTTSTATAPTSQNQSVLDTILNNVLSLKTYYQTAPEGFREKLIDQLSATYGETYRQFIVDTIYRELRSMGEPTYKPPDYPVYTGEYKELSEDEFKKALEEAQTYYGYTIPTGRAPSYYPVEEAEITAEAKTLEERAIEDYEYNLQGIENQKKQLLEDYQNYLSDIETGKLRAGSDQQRQLEQALEQKRLWLEQQEIAYNQNLQALQRGWIGKGGLFSGPRALAVGQFEQMSEAEKQQYLSQWQYGQTTAQTAYERAMEDYLKGATRAGTQYQMSLAEQEQRTARYGVLKERTVADVALAKIRDIRSLQEKYQEAIAKRMATSLGVAWSGY